MKISISIGLALFASIPAFLLNSCLGDSNPVEDTRKTAAIRKVDLSVDTGTVEPLLPDSAQSGRSFDDLYVQDSTTYTNPANYGVELAYHFLVDNTAEEAEDAKFDGLLVDIVFDTLSDSPVAAESGPFEVAKGEVKKVSLTTSMNLATHRLPCLYVFEQMVAGAKIRTTLSPDLNYKIGSVQGVIEIPDIVVNIPTRASDETKSFLNEMLQSGLFEE